MSKHFYTEIDVLKRKLLLLGVTVEECLTSAVKAIHDADSGLARRVIDQDSTVDMAEVEIEEDCLKILALYQPVATDLRFIVTVLKINNDLERIGDLAVNIAERALFLANQPPVRVPFNFEDMAAKAQTMLRNSLTALVEKNVEAARRVCQADAEVDAIHKRMYDDVQRAITEHADELPSLLQLMTVSRNLERVSDHATNIAEDVIYLVHGDIVRHRMKTASPACATPSRQSESPTA